MKTKREIEEEILKLLKIERENGNSNLKESRMSPRRQGKIRALRWVLELVGENVNR